MGNSKDYISILSMAIENEVEAYEFYLGVSQKVEDPNIKSIFKELAEQELGHRDLLSSYLNSNVRPLNFGALPDYKVSETVDKPKLSMQMKPVDAIALAMKNEEDAMKMYTDLANSSADAAQKKLFMNLANMEKGHKVQLEDIYTNMAFPEAW
ncbi:MAG TPA: ferritin family protein [Syntrophomonas sp.]|nr:ferritin family protein [Syntrophomonas sp.]HRW11535.1 ferritin family protein [Syntrophomonas sp.]